MIMLRFKERLKCREVAALCGVHVKTVNSVVRRLQRNIELLMNGSDVIEEGMIPHPLFKYHILRQ